MKLLELRAIGHASMQQTSNNANITGNNKHNFTERQTYTYTKQTLCTPRKCSRDTYDTIYNISSITYTFDK